MDRNVMAVMEEKLCVEVLLLRQKQDDAFDKQVKRFTKFS